MSLTGLNFLHNSSGITEVVMDRAHPRRLVH
jgi:hypothetical protein